tara:strand:+ start:120 stop:896 length:777 start_codon:yes stop_codon:yes gene_type:complete
MEIKVNKKEMVDALKKVEIKGKWATTSGLSSKPLGRYIQFQLDGNRLLLINSDESTTAIIAIDVETEDEGRFVLDADNLKKYLIKMSDEITFEVNDTVVMKSSGKRATMPIVVEHPFQGRIERFVNQWPFAWEEDLENIPTVGVIDFNAGIQVSAEEFYNSIDACEVVNNGIYKLNFIGADDLSRPKFIISSEEIISSYREELPFSKVIGESATVLFSGPLHKFFGRKGTINIFIGDDQPIIMVTENSAIVRAPRIGI